MKTIYKYEITPNQHELLLPLNSTILSVETQFDARIVLYALVDPEVHIVEMHRIEIFGTGDEVHIGPKFKFLGTVKLADGRFMFHVFYNSPSGADA